MPPVGDVASCKLAQSVGQVEASSLMSHMSLPQGLVVFWDHVTSDDGGLLVELVLNLWLPLPVIVIIGPSSTEDEPT